MGSSKSLQIRHQRKIGSLGLSNFANAKFAEIIKLKSQEGPNHLLSVKNTKIYKEKGVCHTTLFPKTSLLSSIFTIIRDFTNVGNIYKGHLLSYRCTTQWVTYKLFLGKHHLLLYLYRAISYPLLTMGVQICAPLIKP